MVAAPAAFLVAGRVHEPRRTRVQRTAGMLVYILQAEATIDLCHGLGWLRCKGSRLTAVGASVNCKRSLFRGSMIRIGRTEIATNLLQRF